jgi:hypothetical protein
VPSGFPQGPTPRVEGRGPTGGSSSAPASALLTRTLSAVPEGLPPSSGSISAPNPARIDPRLLDAASVGWTDYGRCGTNNFGTPTLPRLRAIEPGDRSPRSPSLNGDRLQSRPDDAGSCLEALKARSAPPTRKRKCRRETGRNTFKLLGTSAPIPRCPPSDRCNRRSARGG